MTQSKVLNNEYKPKCPACRCEDFVAVSNGHVQGADKKIAMIICSDMKCQTVVGVLPESEIWEESEESSKKKGLWG